MYEVPSAVLTLALSTADRATVEVGLDVTAMPAVADLFRVLDEEAQETTPRLRISAGDDEVALALHFDDPVSCAFTFRVAPAVLRDFYPWLMRARSMTLVPLVAGKPSSLTLQVALTAFALAAIERTLARAVVSTSGEVVAAQPSEVTDPIYAAGRGDIEQFGPGVIQRQGTKVWVTPTSDSLGRRWAVADLGTSAAADSYVGFLRQLGCRQ